MTRAKVRNNAGEQDFFSFLSPSFFCSFFLSKRNTKTSQKYDDNWKIFFIFLLQRKWHNIIIFWRNKLTLHFQMQQLTCEAHWRAAEMTDPSL
jgi:hypothetical protein